MDGYDEGFSESPISDNDLAEVARLADEQAKLEGLVEAAEAALKAANAALKQVREYDLPELMNKLGLETFTTKAGTKISIKDILRVATTGKYRPFIMKWLRENDLTAIISRVLSVEFGKGEDKKAEAALKALAKLDLLFSDAENINAGTFKALIKEKLEAGETVPIEDLGISRAYQSKVERK